jgi:hypothetical protein
MMACFADFGLSVVLDSDEAIDFAWNRMHDLNFWNYYRQLGPPKITLEDGTVLGVNYRLLWNVGKDSTAKINALRVMDWICLVGSMHNFLRDDPNQQFLFLQFT